MYALPEPYTATFTQDLAIAVAQKPEHISAYALTIEGRNLLAAQAAAGRIQEPPPGVFASQFEYLHHTLAHAGYEQYEISNFAQLGQRAVHNSGYWHGVPYLGIGPSAHSYDGRSTRFANVRNLHAYMERISAGELAGEPEYLTTADLHNEFWLTRLRLIEPLTQTEVVSRLGLAAWLDCQPRFDEWQQQNLVTRINDQTVALTLQGRLQADRLAAELFVESPES
jgi:oxygen-independent coproporphyrinogen-3 oxidase